MRIQRRLPPFSNSSRNFLLILSQTLRIVIAIARAWEARVDNRLYEVGLAEAL
jgi:hypothetical protein